MSLNYFGQNSPYDLTTSETTEVWADTKPGPVEAYESGPGWSHASSPNKLFDKRDYLMHKHQDHKKRIRIIRDIITGDWEKRWPGMSAEPMVPAVANVIEQAYSHWVSIFGSVEPQIKVPIPEGKSIAGGKSGSRKRERRLRELWFHSKMSEVSAALGGDLAATGMAMAIIWADFKMMPQKRMPRVYRIDPLHAYPVKDEQGCISELLVVRRWDVDTWMKNNPDFKAVFRKSEPSDLEEWFWYDKDEFKLIVADVSGKGRKQGRIRIVHEEKNHLGRIPAYEAVTAQIDSQRRGMFDQAIGPLYHAQLLALHAVTAVEQELYSPLVEYMADDVDKVGPGGIISLQEKDGFVQRLESQSTFDIRTTVMQELEFVRQQVAFPAQLQGETGGSIVSAQGVREVQGQIDSRLAYGHRLIEKLFSNLSEMMLEFDECYCPGARTIYGDSTERIKGETYDPKQDVAGNYRAVVTYGIGAGSDQTNKELRLNTAFQTGAISMATYQNELGYVKDPDMETMATARYEIFQSMKDRIRQQILMGEINEEVAKVVKLLNENDSTTEKVVEEMIKGIQESRVMPDQGPGGGAGGMMPPEPMPSEGVMEEAPDGAALAENIARGGDGQNPGAQAGPLPPLPSVLSGNRAGRTLN